jgi:hypothetical protein
LQSGPYSRMSRLNGWNKDIRLCDAATGFPNGSLRNFFQ